MRAERQSLVLAVAAVTAVAVLDVATGPGTALTGLLIIGPLIAAGRLGPGRTAAVAVYALALSIVLGLPDHAFGAADHVIQSLVVATGGLFSTLAADQRSRREQALLRMTRIAEVAQRAILRPIPPRIGQIRFAARYLSAAEEALIGGDLYDAAFTPYGLRVIVGDVKGKGLDAVRLASMVLGAFREAAFAHDDLLQLADDLDRSIQRYLGDEDFVTGLVAEFDPGGELRMVNCGHPPPLLVRPELAELLASATPTTPFGLNPTPSLERFTLGPADRVLLYTDGLVEARGPGGDLFELDDKVGHLLSTPSLNSALDGLVSMVLDHVGGHLDDDLALVLAQP